MVLEVFPVACPCCGESQNVTPAGFDPEAEPFGPVHCMVCQHRFGRREYLDGLETKRLEADALSAGWRG